MDTKKVANKLIEATMLYASLEQQKPILDPKDIRINTFSPNYSGSGFSFSVPRGVELIHVPSGITVKESDDRSQHRNKAIAWIKLVQLVDEYNKKVHANILDPFLPVITEEEMSLLHYNPNTEDIVMFVQDYAKRSINNYIDALRRKT